MTSSRQNRVLRRFTERPPELAGGLQLEVEPIDDDHVLVLIFGDEHRFRARASGLKVPYPSGLHQLIASDPSVELVLVERGSRGLEQAARDEGVGYLDLRGRGYLQGPGFVYVVPAHPMPGGGVDIEAEPYDYPRESAALVSKSPTRVSPFAPKA